MNPDSIDGDYFPMDECELSQRGSTEDAPLVDRPYVGKGIWLTKYPTSDVMEAVTAFSSGDSGLVAHALPRLRVGIAANVLAHDLHNVQTGEDLPQFWGAPEAVILPVEALVYIAKVIVAGELPTARPKGSPNGRAGTTTLTSSAPKIRRSPAARPRQRSG